MIRRSAAAMIAVIVVASAGVGCGDAAGPEELRAGFAEVTSVVAVTDVYGPKEVKSKGVTYLSGRGLVDGEPDAAADRAVSGLRDAGWDVREIGTGSAGAGVRVVVSSGDVTAKISMYKMVGENEAPEGSSIVQIQVASDDAGLGWTN